MIALAARNLIEDYQARGWRLVLLDAGSKQPSQTGWPNTSPPLTDVLAHLERGGNIGVALGEPSGHLADIDLDCPQAVAAASAFLPPTGRIHGRASKPSSHYWYVSAGVQTKRLKDTDGTCLLELRGTGTQTVIPPSVHPSKEPFAWVAEGDPAPVTADALRSAFVTLGACVLMSRHWPTKGDRHDCTLALSGMLLNAGWSPEQVTKVVTHAAKLGGDEDWSKRRVDVETTSRRLDAGEPVTGAGNLAGIVGEDVVKRLREWLGLDASTEQSTAVLLRPLTSLTKPAKPEAVESALRRVVLGLNGASPLRRETVRESAIESLKGLGVASPARLVDAAFDTHPPLAKEGTGQGQALVFPAIEPWPDPVDGATVLDEVAATYRRFVILPDYAYDAVALWVMHAHAEAAAFCSPILCLSSPEKRCGKTTTLIVTTQLVPKPLDASNVTAAAIFRTMEAHAPTLLLDEADTYIRDNEEMRGIINSGHTRPTAKVVRLVGDDHAPRVFSTWGPKLIALIRNLPATLEDRSIVIPHNRRAPNEVVEKLRLDRLEGEFEPLRRQLARWAQEHVPSLKSADPAVPAGLHDRAADNWRPLLAIADEAGGEWPERARRAAVMLTANGSEDTSSGVQLLADVREAFPQDQEWVSSEDLLSRLVRMPDRPWGTYKNGRPMTPKALGRFLGSFGISSRMKGHDRSHGYSRATFLEAWARYVGGEVSGSG